MNCEIINGRKYKKCKDNKIRNPYTNRCILKNSLFGKNILKSLELNIQCPEDKILNLYNNECISKKSNIGKKFLKQYNYYNYKKLKKSIIKKNNKSISDITTSDKSISDKSISDKSLSDKSISDISISNTSIDKENVLLYNRKINLKKNIKYINKNKINNNNCLLFYKKDNNDNLFLINNTKIIIKNIDKNNNIYKIINNDNIAIKIIIDNNINRKDIEINKKLNEIVINNICPHFPLYYTNFECNKNNNIINKKYDIIYPQIIRFNKDKSFLYVFKEVYNGNFKDFIKKNYKNSELIKNSISQILLSILFFNTLTNYYHKNTNWNNFLYYKLENKGGYIHYKILDNDYYLENLGYLWIINDFKTATNINKNNELSIDYDIYKFNKGFIDKNNQLDNNIKLFNFIDNNIINLYKQINFYHIKYYTFKKYNKDNYKNLTKGILYLLKINNFIKTKINDNDIIINKNPFILEL